MKNTLKSVWIIILAASAAQAGPFYTLDQRVNSSSLRVWAQTLDQPNTQRIPKSFLAKNHLFYVTVTGTSDPSLDMGIISDVSYISQKVADGKVTLALAAAAVGDPNSQVGQEVASFTAQDLGSELDIDLSTDMAIKTEGGVYKAERPDRTQDVVLTADRLTYTQVFTMKNVEPAQENAPPTISLAIRFYMLDRPETGYQPKSYPAADRTRSGFFSLSTFHGLFSDFPANDYLMRWDLRKPITYTLHPSVPEKYRAKITASLLSWNKVFKATRNVEPIKVVSGTDQAVMPGDPDTAVVYWFPGEVPKMYLGQARPLADPRTGEVFTSYLLLSESEIDGAVSTQQVLNMVEQAGQGAKNQVSELILGDGRGLKFFPRSESIFHAAAQEIELLDSGAGAILDQLLDFTIVHETGHSLGLRHNFKATSDVANLAPGEFSTSVMDYVPATRAPRVPQGYDYKTIAYGYDGQVPGGFSKPYGYGADEHAVIDPDANVFDIGEPLSYFTGQFRITRRARATVPVLAKPRVYLALLSRATRDLPKFLINGQDPRSPKALEFFHGQLAAEGPAAQGGGNGGQVSTGQIPPELMNQKNLLERVATLSALASRNPRLPMTATARQALIADLTNTFVDPDKSDLFPARVVAIPAFVGLGEPGLLALVEGTKKIVAYAQANPSAPTIQQEVALVKAVQELLQGGQEQAKPQAAAMTAIRDLLDHLPESVPHSEAE